MLSIAAIPTGLGHDGPRDATTGWVVGVVRSTLHSAQDPTSVFPSGMRRALQASSGVNCSVWHHDDLAAMQTAYFIIAYLFNQILQRKALCTPHTGFQVRSSALGTESCMHDSA
jgi:hypothetical protein